MFVPLSDVEKNSVLSVFLLGTNVWLAGVCAAATINVVKDNAVISVFSWIGNCDVASICFVTAKICYCGIKRKRPPKNSAAVNVLHISRKSFCIVEGEHAGSD